mgnify:CR=1 FL=1
MKIIHVIHSYWPVVGGIENAVKSLAEEQAKLGHEVHVVASAYGTGDRPREEVVNRVNIHRIKAVRLMGYPDLTLPLEYPNILKDADIVHGHSQNSLFTVKMLEYARKHGVKTAIYFMAIDALDDHPNPIIRLIGPIYARKNLYKAIETTDIKLAKSIRDVKMLREKYHVDDVYYVPDGVSDYIINAPNMAEEFRGRYGINGPFVVYVGRLHPMKGIHVLIKAMAHVVREVKDAKAVIVGPGDQKPYRQLANKLGLNNAVVFLGYVDEDAKIGAIDASTALVLPSISNYVEVFSIVTSEAWARQKPVIASAVGELPYRIRHMENGILVPPKDPKALANAITTLLNDKELAKKVGARGREEVKTWSEIAKQINELYIREYQ